MEINYLTIAIVTIAIMIALFFYFRRNSKDKRDLSKTLNASETQPDKHDEKVE